MIIEKIPDHFHDNKFAGKWVIKSKFFTIEKNKDGDDVACIYIAKNTDLVKLSNYFLAKWEQIIAEKEETGAENIKF